MNIDDYQKQAHSTAVHGGTLAYPIAALAEEAAEVCDVWRRYVDITDADRLRGTPPTVTDTMNKLHDELGDVMWNLAELVYLLYIPMSSVYDAISMSHPSKELTSVPFLALASSVGKLNGIWAKYIRKHDGAQPSVAEVVAEQTEDLRKLRKSLERQCALVTCDVKVIAAKCGFEMDDILQANLDKLAARKKANTLGGAGSVERKS